jgi:hypothetical protein
MDSKICNPSDGRSGGLLMLYKKDIKVELIFSAPMYIDVKIIERDDKVWRFTGIYGESRWEHKYKTWDKIRELKNNSQLPWVILGDFNELLYSHEKEGGNPRPQRCMQAFRDCLVDCSLEDMGFSGDSFTWKRGKIRERLDRAVSNGSWTAMHPGAVVQHLGYIKSDHRPILLDTDFQNVQVHPKSGPQRFEAKWLMESEFREEVRRAWDTAASVDDGVMGRLGRMHSALHAWDSQILRKPKRRLRKAQRELEKAMNGPLSDENEAKAKEMANLIELLLEQDEVYWAQRSRSNWLHQGDRNTTFFHNYASARRKKNFISRLKNENNEWVDGTDSLKPLILDYFSNLFSSEINHVDPDMMEKVLPRVDADMNEVLLAPFAEDDVKKAIFSIGDLKAPGPDGLHAVFYKKFWDICGTEITTEVLQALNSGVIPEGWNDTTVVLIPKIDDPENISQFRPISLCNVIYKIISKILAHRLKGILPEVISPTQSAFVPGRLITDNVLVAYECVHAIKNKRSGSNGTCAVKLDMHKAYDRVEWVFLENMMRRMGFAERWIGLMMACVSSVRYQVRFNSEETEMFVPTRGLRQGDPLSPYLFLLCAEGLSSLLLHEEEVGGIDGVRVCRNAPSVSHLLFADDSLILMKADMNNATSLQYVLDTYCANSGQLVSLAKSSVFFSPNTNALLRAEICEALHIDTEALSDKYLGLPALVGADRSIVLNILLRGSSRELMAGRKNFCP